MAVRREEEVMNPQDQGQAALGNLEEALASAGELAVAAARLHAEQGSLVADLRTALRDVLRRQEALTLLGAMEPEATVELLPDLTEIALSHRDTIKVRQLLGRISLSESREVVPAAVWAQLSRTNDDDAYRRMAELLMHLGLGDALQELCSWAAASDEKTVREVAEDFCDL